MDKKIDQTYDRLKKYKEIYEVIEKQKLQLDGWKDTDQRIKKQQKSVEELCAYFIFTNPEEFRNSVAISLLEDYYNEYKRLLYSSISNCIFDLKDEQRTYFQNNAEKVLFSLDTDSDIYPTMLKFYDHVNLAINQISDLRQSDEEFELKFEQKFFEKATPTINKLERDIHEEGKRLTGQLVSLVGIFTAMAFIVFGSLSQLDNIFATVGNVPLIELCIVGAIWGLCVLNLVFVFMYFISKMTKTSIDRTVDKNLKVKVKYQLLIWCNLVMMTVLTFCCCVYLLPRETDYSLVNEARIGLLILFLLIWCSLLFTCIYIGVKIIKRPEKEE